MKYALLTSNKLEQISDEKFEVHPSFQWVEIDDNFVVDDYNIEDYNFVKRDKELETDIYIGEKIKDEIFNTNPNSQLRSLRKAVWANSVINDFNRSKLDSTYVRKFTDKDVITADLIIDQSIELNKQVEEMISRLR